MIKSFKHKGLERFFKTGDKSGIIAKHANRLRILLIALDSAQNPKQMDMPGWQFHPLKRDLAGHYAVSVNGNWRITFTFKGEDAEIVDYQDYH